MSKVSFGQILMAIAIGVVFASLQVHSQVRAKDAESCSLKRHDC